MGTPRRRLNEIRNCVICGKPFQPYRDWQKTDSPGCYSVMWEREHAGRPHASKRGRAQAKAQISDEELERRLNEFWARKASPDSGRQARSPLCDVARWL